MKKEGREQKENSKKATIIILLVLIVLLVLVNILSLIVIFKPKLSLPDFPETSPELVKVIEVIDGDTIKIENNEYIRLIGMNAPEEGSYFYTESKNFISLLVLNKTVRLEKDKDNRDNYGRLLRYVYSELYGREIFINEESVRQGYSIPLSIEPNTKYQEEIETARQDCLKSKLNLCS